MTIFRNILMAIAIGWCSTGYAQEFPIGEAPEIKPQAADTLLKEAKIDTESWEIGPYYGIYAFEGLGGSGVLGVRFAYHLPDEIFFEGRFALSRLDQGAFRRVTGRPLLTDTDFNYWGIDVGYNLFPGQIFLTREKTLYSTIYLITGAGQTRFDRRNHFTVNMGTGYKVFLTDWMDIRTDLRSYALETDFTGKKERIFNLEGTVAIAVFF
jgi:outer membrane beta-barrel protein